MAQHLSLCVIPVAAAVLWSGIEDTDGYPNATGWVDLCERVDIPDRNQCGLNTIALRSFVLRLAQSYQSDVKCGCAMTVTSHCVATLARKVTNWPTQIDTETTFQTVLTQCDAIASHRQVSATTRCVNHKANCVDTRHPTWEWTDHYCPAWMKHCVRSAWIACACDMCAIDAVGSYQLIACWETGQNIASEPYPMYITCSACSITHGEHASTQRAALRMQLVVRRQYVGPVPCAALSQHKYHHVERLSPSWILN